MDIINFLSDTSFTERADRAQATENAQLSFEALLEGKFPERYAVAAFVAGLHRSTATDFYLDLLSDDTPELIEPIRSAVARGLARGGQGPTGGQDATWLQLGQEQELAPLLGKRLVAALDFAHYLIFHPADAAPQHLEPLAQVFTEDETVTLAQLISFLSFQLRVVHGLAILGGKSVRTEKPVAAGESVGKETESTAERPAAGIYTVQDYPDLVEPTHFVHH